MGAGRGHPHGYDGRGMGGHMGPGMPPFGGGMRGMHPMAAMAKMQEVLLPSSCSRSLLLPARPVMRCVSPTGIY
jgi:hypothetical protein